MSQLSTQASLKSMEKSSKVRDTKSREKRNETSRQREEREEFLLKNRTGTSDEIKSSASAANIRIFRNESDVSVRESNSKINKGNLKCMSEVKLAEKENFVGKNGCGGSKGPKNEKVLRIPSSCSSRRSPLTSKVIEPKLDAADDILSACSISQLLKLYENQFKILHGLQKNRANLVAFLKKIQLAKGEKLQKLLENAKNESEMENIQAIQAKFEKLDELKAKYLERGLRKPFENIVNKMSNNFQSDPKLLFP